MTPVSRWIPAAALVMALAGGTAIARAQPPAAPVEPAGEQAGQDEVPQVKETVEVEGRRTPPLDAGVPAQFTVDAEALSPLRGALLDDPLRALQALPGVATTDELRAELSVRASPFRHVGLVIDEVKSRLLMHTVRGVEQTGSVALINGDTVAGASLSAGSYPQRYGNSLGAELVVRTRDGRGDRIHGRVMSSLIATTASAEGPAGSDRLTWLVAARRSYASWIVTRIDPGLSGTFDFQDAFAKTRARIGERQHVSLLWLGGTSRYDERGRRTADYALDVGRNRTNLVTAQWQITPRPTWLVAQRVSYVSARFRNTNPTGRVLDAGREREWLARTSATWTSAALSVDGSVNVERTTLSGDAVRFGGTQSGAMQSFAGDARRVGGHVHVLAQPAARVQIGAGLRLDHIRDIATVASPWAQVALALTPHWRLQAAHGWHRQAPELLMRAGPNAGLGLDVERARHTDAGLDWTNGPWSASLTAYLRQERDVLDVPARFARRPTPDGPVWPGDPRAPWLNALAGDARGVELAVRRQAGRWQGWASYARGHLRQRLPWDEPEFRGPFEQAHLFNAALSARLDERWDASAVVRLASNWPYEGYFAQRDESVFLAAARNRLGLPTYARVDLRLRRTIPVGAYRLVVFGEAINLLNRRNIRQVEGSFNARTGAVGRLAEEQLPIVPSIGLAFEW